MSANGLSHGSRLLSITLAVGVHAVAAAAFMLTPKMEPPPPEGVEIEMLAEITSVVAEEVPPSVAAEAEQIEEASETQPGETASMDGEVAEAVASLDPKRAEVTPQAVEESAKPEIQPEAEKPRDVEETPPVEASVTMPVEIEQPKVEAPQAPAVAKPKTETRKTETKKSEATKTEKKAAKKKTKTQARRLAVAGSTLSKEAKRKGQSSAQSSGGRKSSSEYRSIVQARLSARRGAISARAGAGVRGRVIIAFSIGASGRVTSASVSRSSGNVRLDAAARSVVASTSFPPPPGGSYRRGIPISVE
jgi:protein TonB